MKKRVLNLQLFAEEAAGSAETNNPPATDTADTSITGDGQIATGEGSEENFEDLIKGRYKKDFDTHVQGILKKRFGERNAAEERFKKVGPVLDMFARRYGIDAADLSDEKIDEITGKILEDDSFYEDEALKRGMDIETLKTLERTERENAELRRFRQETEQTRESQAKFENLQRQVQQVQQVYPGFDLDTEMANPTFQRLTWGAGVPLQTAYEVVHRDEILTGAMQYATQRTAEKVANSVRAGARRPSEAAHAGQSAVVAGNKSPKDWSKEEREAIKARVRSGEKVVF